MPFVNDGTLGVNLDKHPTYLTSTCNYPEFPIGDVKRASDGSVWKYGRAVSAISAGLAVCFVNTSEHVKKLTHALSSAVHQIAINDRGAFTSGQYGWFQIGGPTSVTGLRVKGSCANGVNLYTTGTAGVLDDACSVSGNLILGISTTASNTTAASALKAAKIHFGGAVFSKAVT